jgi:hypothetical protein
VNLFSLFFILWLQGLSLSLLTYLSHFPWCSFPLHLGFCLHVTCTVWLSLTSLPPPATNLFSSKALISNWIHRVYIYIYIYIYIWTFRWFVELFYLLPPFPFNALCTQPCGSHHSCVVASVVQRASIKLFFNLVSKNIVCYICGMW